MATRQANIKAVNVERANENPQGALLVTIAFDLIGTVYTAAADTITIGGGGTENGVSTSSTLATIIQNRRRNTKTIALIAVFAGVDPGRLGSATNGPLLYVQNASISGGNVATVKLFSAFTSGSECTLAAASGGWDSAATVHLLCTES